MPLTSEQKAAKRAEIAKRRADNAAAVKVLPIAAKQARLLSLQTGVQEDLLLGEAIFGIAKALSSSDNREFGHYSFCKQAARGYMLNYLRDSYRPVRIPRRLSEVYLAERRLHASHSSKSAVALTDEAVAEALGISLELLRESRSAIALFSSELDVNFNDQMAEQGEPRDSRLETQLDILAQVVQLGIAELTKRSKLDEQQVSDSVHQALAYLAKEAVNRELL